MQEPTTQPKSQRAEPATRGHVEDAVDGLARMIKHHFATKDDLKAFATKDDLKEFATKEDLKEFATKDDLKAFATNDDLQRVKTEILAAFEIVSDELRGANRDEIDYLKTADNKLHRRLRPLEDQAGIPRSEEPHPETI